MKFLDSPPRFLFFTGKGGVGKTSIACASAIELAESGRRVLLVSTDPASNVAQVFGVAIGNTITAIPDVPQLSALEIDPQASAQAYRDRIVGSVRNVLPAAVVKGMAVGGGNRVDGIRVLPHGRPWAWRILYKPSVTRLCGASKSRCPLAGSMRALPTRDLP